MLKTRRPYASRRPRMVESVKARPDIRSLQRIRSRRVGRFKKQVKPLAGPAETGFRQFMAGVTTLKKGQMSGPASHGGEEIYLILDGVGRAHLGRLSRRVKAECVMTIPPHVPHTLEAVSESLRYVWVLAPPQRESLRKLSSLGLSQAGHVSRSPFVRG